VVHVGGGSAVPTAGVSIAKGRVIRALGWSKDVEHLKFDIGLAVGKPAMNIGLGLGTSRDGSRAGRGLRAHGVVIDSFDSDEPRRRFYMNCDLVLSEGNLRQQGNPQQSDGKLVSH